MSNTATIKNSTDVYVNGVFVYTCSSASKATSFKTNLNALFNDADRDLDFITPTYLSSSYAVCCPKVRANQGETTYFYKNVYAAVSRKLYNADYNTSSASSTSVTLLYTIDSTITNPWHEALKLANAIRYAATLNYNCLRETSPSTLAKLAVPTNTSTSVTKTISSSCSVQFYGHPDQGTQSGTQSYSSSLGMYVENIASPVTGNADVLHPVDITAALTSTNSWNTTYKNKYVKVTNGTKSLVVRITDTAPANKGIELTWRAYQALGKPSTVKIELMS